MKLAQLHILDAIVHSESLSDAAKRLHKTQPALTMAIKKLEQSLGFDLLDRSHYRLKLTEKGKTYYTAASYLLEQAKRLDELGEELATGNEASIHLAYEPVCVSEKYNALISQTHQRFAASQLHIHAGTRFSSLQQVVADKATLGIGPWFELFHSEAELQTLTIGTLDMAVLAAPSLLPSGTEIDSDTLANLPCVAMKESNLRFDSERLSLARAKQVIKSDDIGTLKSLLVSGAGWGISSVSYCEQELKSGRLVKVKLTDRQCAFSCDIKIFRKKNRHHGPFARAIWHAFEQLQKQ